jgi:hypothetical protein
LVVSFIFIFIFLQIFVPFIIDQHWSLVVVEPGREVITVLDSFYELRLCEKRHENLVRYFQHQMPCKKSEWYCFVKRYAASTDPLHLQMAQLQKNLYPFIGLENATHRFITPPVVQNQNNR